MLQLKPGALPSRAVRGRPLVDTAPQEDCEVCVVVPVRDEAQLLRGTLEALAHQVDLVGRPFERHRYEVLLLANNCCDDSAAIARRFADEHPDLRLHVIEVHLEAPEAHVGRVRQMLMDEASRRLHGLNRPRGVIASTDGDTRVASTWIAAILAEFARGMDAVGGRILTDPTSRDTLDPHSRACFLLDVGYQSLVSEFEARLDPDPFDSWPRHYQHFGASFALSAGIYERVGGLPSVQTLEDVALYRRLLCFDARFRHSPQVRVFTSARAYGRADAGLAAQLSTWRAMGERREAYLVESVRSIEARFTARRQLRQWWQQTQVGALDTPVSDAARQLGVPPEWLGEELNAQRTFGGLWEALRQRQAGALVSCPFVEIRQAISELRLRLAPWRIASKTGVRGPSALNPECYDP